MADAELGDEAVDRIEDRVQRVAVAGEDHPGGKRAGAFAAERVEGLIDDVAGVGLAGARAFDGFARWSVTESAIDRASVAPAARRPIRNGGADWRGSGRSSAATAFSVTACGPSASSSWRAASIAAERLSSGLQAFAAY